MDVFMKVKWTQFCTFYSFGSVLHKSVRDENTFSLVDQYVSLLKIPVALHIASPMDWMQVGH